MRFAEVIAGSVLLHCCEVVHCMDMRIFILLLVTLGLFPVLDYISGCAQHTCFGGHVNVLLVDVYFTEEWLGQEGRNHTFYFDGI